MCSRASRAISSMMADAWAGGELVADIDYIERSADISCIQH